ncbi:MULTISPECIES: hypothetical protein [unclassified Pseudomonas]|uniref:hypothetical protein n=1 Tax=unclassified Pseudomonas TaxID=196821 RepID=UPI0021C786A0|nr:MULTISPECIES: hypothetical protein [unclassified Pseudomonas]MCU1734860.1 hypothetical protein [Pseudomonas sp. 20P_3.2_Bac4]MCU1744413.1 hypothetical protein [Pseudomonas sp. 20P_3.2_Bac5]
MVFTPFLLLGVDYGIRVLTSVYKTDLGNGVVIYGDEYVKSGLWVFDCKYSRVISRERLPVPLAELSALDDVAIGEMNYLSRRDAGSVKEAIRAIIERPEWYGNLQYAYSGVGESSEIWSHKFFLLTDHAGFKWALEVDQILRLSRTYRFFVTARPYSPETYVDYTKAFEAAVKSCPAPQ